MRLLCGSVQTKCASNILLPFNPFTFLRHNPINYGLSGDALTNLSPFVEYRSHYRHKNKLPSSSIPSAMFTLFFKQLRQKALELFSILTPH